MTFFKLYFLKGLLSFFLIYSFFHKVHSQIMTTVPARNHYNFLSIINFSLFFFYFLRIRNRSFHIEHVYFFKQIFSLVQVTAGIDILHIMMV